MQSDKEYKPTIFYRFDPKVMQPTWNMFIFNCTSPDLCNYRLDICGWNLLPYAWGNAHHLQKLMFLFSGEWNVKEEEAVLPWHLYLGNIIPLCLFTSTFVMLSISLYLNCSPISFKLGTYFLKYWSSIIPYLLLCWGVFGWRSILPTASALNIIVYSGR